jgi:quinol monooxygenase YgiN
MIIVAGFIRIEPAKQDELLRHAKTMIEKTRQEDGCQLYCFAFDLVEPGLMRIYEEWESRPHLDAHAATAHMADWRAALGEIGVAERQVKIFEAEQVGQM